MYRVIFVAIMLGCVQFVGGAMSQGAETKGLLNGSETWDLSRLEEGWEIKEVLFDKGSRMLKIKLQPLPCELEEQLLIRIGCSVNCYDKNGERISLSEVTWGKGEGKLEILKIKLSDIEKALKRNDARKEQVKKVLLTDK